MNIIKDYIKNFLINEQIEGKDTEYVDLGAMTYGNFIQALDIIAKEKSNLKNKENKKKYSKAALKTALSLATGGWSEIISTAMDAGEAVKILTKQDDNNKPQGFLAQIDLDDKTTTILDNNLEDEFIEYLKKKFAKNKNQIMPKRFDINKELNSFLKKNYERQITV